ncbi:MAG TPA: serine/threonine-protein kinase [Gemmatimonadaceae bacterium]|nr:serine/threonine-protein kinase [Gemmatimonadaceae bacterium]
MPDRYLGRRLGRFRVDTNVGSGGFAWVYKGYDPELDIPVAIKILKPQFAGEEAFETRFRTEAATAAKLRHPNIIRILAVGREEAAVYFVMDFLPTGLDDRLRIMGTLPETLLIRLGMDVSAALAFAHREGVIHRDIKTDNVLYDDHGNAIVADFGIARALSGYTEQTGTNMVVGTPQYFSPEQARGQVLDGRADIYSLGVTLFKAATGVLPFQGDDWYEIARQHIEEPAPRPRSFNPALSRGIEQVILKCLAKNPAERYPTGDALHTELVQLLGRASTPDGDPTVVMPTPAASREALAITSPKRLRAPLSRTVAAGAGVLILIATGFGVNAMHQRDATRDAQQQDSIAAATRASAVPVPSVVAPPLLLDTLGHDSFAAGAPRSVARTATRKTSPKAAERVLRVVGPADATITVDGALVGRGTWHSESIASGAHHVVVALNAPAACASAQDAKDVRVGETGTTTVQFAPRRCGAFSLDAAPSGSRFVISVGGHEVASGTVPLSAPVLVPEGSYALHVSSKYCADYSGTVSISPSAQAHERVRLICQ